MADTKIQLSDGSMFDYGDISNNRLDITNIAWAISQQCRFAGHIGCFYSVAQHCIEVSKLCDPEHALEGLMHDASEAFVIDIPSPLKHMPGLDGYRKIEDQVHKLIFSTYKLIYPMPADVIKADKTMLIRELVSFCGDTINWGVWGGWTTREETDKAKLVPQVYPMSQREAFANFLHRFWELKGC